jgi:serine protease Do
MKWSPIRGHKNQNIEGKSRLTLSNSPLTSQVSKMIFCLICTGMFLSGDGDRPKVVNVSASPQQLATKISQIASNISVRILTQNFLGSGFIVKGSGQEYLVITNQHVLRAGEAPYNIETVDGQIYAAEVIAEIETVKNQYDLAVLKFKADHDYQTAKIGNSFRLKVGEAVFAAGFPAQEFFVPKTSNLFAGSEIKIPRKFSLKSGRVAIILNKSLADGYQIGYTNDVKKGMSGGPLLNSRGEVIGINGKHAYPLWEAPETYQDGSEPCPALQELITRSSLAIPIEKTIELTVQLNSLKLPVDLDIPAKANLSQKEQKLVSKMQADAEKTQLQCRRENNPALQF